MHVPCVLLVCLPLKHSTSRLARWQKAALQQAAL